MSYNSTGFSVQTVQFIRTLLDSEKPDILMVQVTFLMHSTLHKIARIHSLYLVHTVCGTDETEKILPGRPSGGLAILWKKTLAKCVTVLKPALDHKRICAIKLRTGLIETLVCNVYMPCDNYAKNHVDPRFIDR